MVPFKGSSSRETALERRASAVMARAAAAVQSTQDRAIASKGCQRCSSSFCYGGAERACEGLEHLELWIGCWKVTILEGGSRLPQETGGNVRLKNFQALIGIATCSMPVMPWLPRVPSRAHLWLRVLSLLCESCSAGTWSWLNMAS